MIKSIAVVGAGFSGSVIARQLAEAGHKISVFEKRYHTAGNCHTERDKHTGIMVHKYGPHIFHTSNKIVWDYVNKFGRFEPFTNRVKAITGNRIYSLPVNLLTINTFFNQTFDPSQARTFIEELSDTNIDEPKSFEDQALKFVGQELYDAFFRVYTEKQWGVSPSLLPASILKRLPLRFNYDDNYYQSAYQGIPLNGYTDLINNILDHHNIEVTLNTHFCREERFKFDHVFFSGPLDSWFNHDEGRLSYRTLQFIAERHTGDFQGNPVINYCDNSFPFTRISEHKHFAPWEVHADTIIYKEYSKNCEPNDEPYYPMRLIDDKILLEKYVLKAREEAGVSFVGRLGTYRYLDMHVVIQEALAISDAFLRAVADPDLNFPTFPVDHDSLIGKS
jgi:UDP-galactopyranose mutase